MEDNNNPKQIKSKREFYDLYNKGVLGNRALTWNSYKEILDSGWRGKVCVRSKKGIARKKVAYNVPNKRVRDVIKSWEKQGYTEENIIFNQSMPDERLTVQGEVRIMPGGYYLTYTTVKEPMNKAFEKWYDEWSITAQCVHPAHSAEEAWKALELHVSKALGGMPESELWGDDGLIAATMRVVDAYEASHEASTDKTEVGEPYKELFYHIVRLLQSPRVNTPNSA